MFFQKNCGPPSKRIPPFGFILTLNPFCAGIFGGVTTFKLHTHFSSERCFCMADLFVASNINSRLSCQLCFFRVGSGCLFYLFLLQESNIWRLTTQIKKNCSSSSNYQRCHNPAPFLGSHPSSSWTDVFCCDLQVGLKKKTSTQKGESTWTFKGMPIKPWGMVEFTPYGTIWHPFEEEMFVFQKSCLGWFQDETCGDFSGVVVENGSRQMVQNPLLVGGFNPFEKY